MTEQNNSQPKEVSAAPVYITGGIGLLLAIGVRYNILGMRDIANYAVENFASPLFERAVNIINEQAVNIINLIAQ